MRIITPMLAIGTLAWSAAAVGDPAQWASEGWTHTDFSKSAIQWNEIMDGGPPKDGIPAIDKPLFKSASDDRDLAPNDPVIGLDVGGDARAYPLRIMIWHEIVNDIVGGKPVAVTYCPLCNSALVFERRAGGKELDFGTTGKLRNSDLVMYDRQTQSWWQQFTGEAIVGSMLGAALKVVPARLESFAEFKSREPAGKVLIPNNPESRGYGRNPYVGYDSAERPFLFRGELPKGIEPMARVVVVKRSAGSPIIIALAKVRRAGQLVKDDIVVSWRTGQASALDRADIARGRDVGTVEVRMRHATGTGPLVPYDLTFAFVANAFHPNIQIEND